MSTFPRSEILNNPLSRIARVEECVQIVHGVRISTSFEAKRTRINAMLALENGTKVALPEVAFRLPSKAGMYAQLTQAIVKKIETSPRGNTQPFSPDSAVF